ncbi:MAG: TonB-dependent receptor, partial [Gammaproteobacteria bacterium]|nr:TonB-dependent receptor [Gammaproteobacteria bacterium]
MKIGHKGLSARAFGLGMAGAMGLFYLPAALAVTEILVTARKIEENVQEVPVSVTPFTSQQIEELNLFSVEDVSRFTAGFTYDSNFGRNPISARPTIRGITTVLNSTAGTSAASFFVDGIYVPGTPQASEVYNLERIEIIKGPQSAQFGRGTYAGAINYVTRQPSMDGWEGGASLTGAEHETWRASAWASAPLIENKLAFYAGIGFDTYGGEYKNQVTGDEIGGEESVSGTVKLLWTPTDNLSITLKGSLLETDDDHYAIYLQGRSNNNCYPRTATTPRAREYYCGTAFVDENDIRLATNLLEQAGGISGNELSRDMMSLTVEYEDPSGFTVTSTTGYVEDDLESGYDVSYYAYDPIPAGASAGSFFQLDKDESTSFNQEFRLTSPQDRPVRATGGIFFLRITDEEIWNRKALSTGELRLQTVANLTKDTIENIALFGGVDWDVTDRLTVGAEARYARDEIKQTNFSNNPVGGAASIIPDRVEEATSPLEKTFTSVTPRFTARYRLTDDANLYASVARGTKPGGFNSSVPIVDGQPDESFRFFDEEDIWAYEIGTKTAWLDNRLVVNVAAYYNDITEGQFTRNIEGPGGVPQSVRDNVGEYDVWGLEVETNWAITDNWVVGFNYAWSDAEYVDNISPDQADLLGGIGTLDDLLRLGSTRG